MRSEDKIALRIGPRVAALLLATTLPLTNTYAQEKATEGEEVLSTPVELPTFSGIFQQFEGASIELRRSAPFARALDEVRRRATSDGRFDNEARIQAFDEAKRDLVGSMLPAEKGFGSGIEPLSTAWTNIGLDGNSSQGVYTAGCTIALAVNPSNSNILYAGAAEGGVWKSTDAGASWVPLTDIVIPDLAVSSIAIDPKNPNTIYIGSGDATGAVVSVTGSGLYKSTDGGGTWNRIGASVLTGTVVKVLVDPIKSNVVFASLYSTCALFRSSDSGVTWTRVYPTSGTAPGCVWDLISGSVVNDVPRLYFVEGNFWTYPSQECGVYSSTDDGLTWAKTGSETLPRGDSIGRASLAASIADPKRVFVLIANPSGGENSETRSLFRTTDDGTNWSSIAIPSTTFFGTTSPQGWYDCILGVSPNSRSLNGNDLDTIYIGGVEAYVNYSDGSGWQCYSDNGSNFWTTHVDHHSFAFNPQNSSIVYDGDDGGIYWSQDAGKSWAYRSNQMVTGRFYHLALSPTSDSRTTLGGAQDQGTWRLVSGGNDSMLYIGDGMQPILSPGSTFPYFNEWPNGRIYRCYQNEWQPIDTGFSDNASWETPFAMSIVPVGSIAAYHVLYAGRQYLWQSTNDGSFWAQLSPSFGGIYSIGLSPVDYRNIFLGLSGQIERTTDAGSSWTSYSTGLPNAPVSSIVSTGHNTNFILASFAVSPGNGMARVMRSTDKGATWSNRSGSLPDAAVNCIALDSAYPQRIWYAATDNGIYYTKDSGASWTVAGAGLGLAPCRDVQVHKNGTTIRVATYGRGIWEANSTALPIELSSLTYQKLQRGVLLLWSTYSENGDAGFWVERSIDGNTFDDLDFVPSKAAGGTSSELLNYTWNDQEEEPGEYLYRLKQIDLDGSEHFSNTVELHWGVTQMLVYQSCPNPFILDAGTPGQGACFTYELPDDDVVSIKIYNAMGQLITFANDGAEQMRDFSETAGEHEAFWNGMTDGTPVSSGTYFYVIESQHFGTFVNRMSLISK